MTDCEESEEQPLEPSSQPTVAGSSALFQSLSWVFRRGGDQQRWAARQLLLRAGVWLPVETYRMWPVVLPWVVRDNSVAHSKGHAITTGKPLKMTASPATGLSREDNKPVGGLKNSLKVTWAGGLHETFKSKPLKDGTHEWMQSHCWSSLSATGQSTATHPLTNSFVPNLIWLPDAMGRLTDDERLVFADEVRAIAWARYRYIDVHPALRDVVEEAWCLLDPPNAEGLRPEELTRVNEFVVPAKFYRTQTEKVRSISSYLTMLQEGKDVTAVDLTPAVYKESLVTVNPEVRADLQQHLRPFVVAAEQLVVPALETPHPGKKAKEEHPSARRTYTVVSPSGTFSGLARYRAALRLVHGVIGVGVKPTEVQQVLKANIRRVPGTTQGAALWDVMAAGGAPGTEATWFVDEPIHEDGDTWVLKKNSWDQKLAVKAFPALEELSGGQVKVSSEPGLDQHIT